MRSIIFHSALLFCFLLFSSFFCTTSEAVTIQAAPSSAETGQRVRFTVVSTYNSIPSCIMQVNYGDSNNWQSMASCGVNPCSRSVNHSYSTAGTYRVSTRPAGGFNCVDLIAPTTAATTVRISDPAPSVPTPVPPPVATPPTPTLPQKADLPDGIVGMEYEYMFIPAQSRYRLTIGRLPQGLKLVRNSLQGIPSRKGKYRFQVRATDNSGTTLDTWYTLRITTTKFSVTVNPKKTQVDRNRAGTFKLSYIFTSKEQIDDNLVSVRGVFLAGARQLGTAGKRISTQMTKGRARLEEQVVVPRNIVKTALRLGINRITYQRTFTAEYMDSQTTASTAIAVGTGFTLTSMRIYFADDHASKKFVRRNERIIKVSVDIRYEGTGLLKGYWQADRRILARVTKNLPFANAGTITLDLPALPPVPTYSTGSHRLRFVVTKPAMRIPFPRVIYIVAGETPSSHPIPLYAPADSAEIPLSAMAFSWESSSKVTMYRVDFFMDPDRESFFSAFSKTGSYTVPASICSKKFAELFTDKEKENRYMEKKLYWRVTGLDREQNPVAQSRVFSFTLLPD